jgi:eukaryotic-like serine/threonine-protein kinase
LLQVAVMSAAVTTQPKDPLGLLGATLAGKYDVERLVAETEFSAVYQAHHRILRRPVAIKAFKAPGLDESLRQQLLESFVTEGALLMDLSERCAAVCQARDVASVVTESGHWVPYLVLEWLEGEPLDVVLARERRQGIAPRTVVQAMRLLEPVAQALAVAHERGIAHRDVKPGNVIILADATAHGVACKLIDFGSAKVARNQAGLGGEGAAGRLFTPMYAAPEQFLPRLPGRPLLGVAGPWTDVFALALLLVELWTGREPRRGESVAELAHSAWSLDVRPTPRTLGATVSDELERVMARAVALRPLDRYASVRAFWSALEQAAALDASAHGAAWPSVGTPRPASTSTELTRTDSVVPRRRRPAPRFPWIVPALALLGAAAGEGIVALARFPVGPIREPIAVSGLPAPATVVEAMWRARPPGDHLVIQTTGRPALPRDRVARAPEKLSP